MAQRKHTTVYIGAPSAIDIYTNHLGRVKITVTPVNEETNKKVVYDSTMEPMPCFCCTQPTTPPDADILSYPEPTTPPPADTAKLQDPSPLPLNKRARIEMAPTSPEPEGSMLSYPEPTKHSPN